MDELRNIVVKAVQPSTTSENLGLAGLQRYEPLRLPEDLEQTAYFWLVYDHRIGCWVQNAKKHKTEASCQKECDRLNRENTHAQD